MKYTGKKEVLCAVIDLVEEEDVELAFDVIDLDADFPKTPEEIVYDWNLTVIRNFNQQIVSEDKDTVYDKIQWYLRELQTDVIRFTDLETSANVIVKHIRCLSSLYKRSNSIFSDKYFNLMEDILVIYCNIVIRFITTKRNTVKNREIKRLIIQECRKIKCLLPECLINHMDRVFHVLMNVNVDPTSQPCRDILTNIYSYFLTRLAQNKSDENFLRAYIIFQKWKQIRKPEEHDTMDKCLYTLYNKQPEQLTKIEVFRKVLLPAMKMEGVTSGNVHPDFVAALLNNYSKYFKNKFNASDDELFVTGELQGLEIEGNCNNSDLGNKSEDEDFRDEISNWESELSVKNSTIEEKDDDVEFVSANRWKIGNDVKELFEDADLPELTIFNNTNMPLPMIDPTLTSPICDIELPLNINKEPPTESFTSKQEPSSSSYLSQTSINLYENNNKILINEQTFTSADSSQIKLDYSSDHLPERTKGSVNTNCHNRILSSMVQKDCTSYKICTESIESHLAETKNACLQDNITLAGANVDNEKSTLLQNDSTTRYSGDNNSSIMPTKKELSKNPSNESPNIIISPNFPVTCPMIEESKMLTIDATLDPPLANPPTINPDSDMVTEPNSMLSNIEKICEPSSEKSIANDEDVVLFSETIKKWSPKTGSIANNIADISLTSTTNTITSASANGLSVSLSDRVGQRTIESFVCTRDTCEMSTVDAMLSLNIPRIGVGTRSTETTDALETSNINAVPQSHDKVETTTENILTKVDIPSENSTLNSSLVQENIEAWQNTVRMSTTFESPSLIQVSKIGLSLPNIEPCTNNVTNMYSIQTKNSILNPSVAQENRETLQSTTVDAMLSLNIPRIGVRTKNTVTKETLETCFASSDDNISSPSIVQTNRQSYDSSLLSNIKCAPRSRDKVETTTENILTKVDIPSENICQNTIQTSKNSTFKILPLTKHGLTIPNIKLPKDTVTKEKYSMQIKNSSLNPCLAQANSETLQSMVKVSQISPNDTAFSPTEKKNSLSLDTPKTEPIKIKVTKNTAGKYYIQSDSSVYNSVGETSKITSTKIGLNVAKIKPTRRIATKADLKTYSIPTDINELHPYIVQASREQSAMDIPEIPTMNIQARVEQVPVAIPAVSTIDTTNLLTNEVNTANFEIGLSTIETLPPKNAGKKCMPLSNDNTLNLSEVQTTTEPSQMRDDISSQSVGNILNHSIRKITDSPVHAVSQSLTSDSGTKEESENTECCFKNFEDFLLSNCVSEQCFPLPNSAASQPLVIPSNIKTILDPSKNINPTSIYRNSLINDPKQSVIARHTPEPSMPDMNRALVRNNGKFPSEPSLFVSPTSSPRLGQLDAFSTKMTSNLSSDPGEGTTKHNLSNDYSYLQLRYSSPIINIDQTDSDNAVKNFTDLKLDDFANSTVTSLNKKRITLDSNIQFEQNGSRLLVDDSSYHMQDTTSDSMFYATGAPTGAPTGSTIYYEKDKRKSVRSQSNQNIIHDSFENTEIDDNNSCHSQKLRIIPNMDHDKLYGENFSKIRNNSQTMWCCSNEESFANFFKSNTNTPYSSSYSIAPPSLTEASQNVISKPSFFNSLDNLKSLINLSISLPEATNATQIDNDKSFKNDDVNLDKQLNYELDKNTAEYSSKLSNTEAFEVVDKEDLVLFKNVQIPTNQDLLDVLEGNKESFSPQRACIDINKINGPEQVTKSKSFDKCSTFFEIRRRKSQSSRSEMEENTSVSDDESEKIKERKRGVQKLIDVKENHKSQCANETSSTPVLAYGVKHRRNQQQYNCEFEENISVLNKTVNTTSAEQKRKTRNSVEKSTFQCRSTGEMRLKISREDRESKSKERKQSNEKTSRYDTPPKKTVTYNRRYSQTPQEYSVKEKYSQEAYEDRDSDFVDLNLKNCIFAVTNINNSDFVLSKIDLCNINFNKKRSYSESNEYDSNTRHEIQGVDNACLPPKKRITITELNMEEQEEMKGENQELLKEEQKQDTIEESVEKELNSEHKIEADISYTPDIRINIAHLVDDGYNSTLKTPAELKQLPPTIEHINGVDRLSQYQNLVHQLPQHVNVSNQFNKIANGVDMTTNSSLVYQLPHNTNVGSHQFNKHTLAVDQLPQHTNEIGQFSQPTSVVSQFCQRSCELDQLSHHTNVAYHLSQHLNAPNQFNKHTNGVVHRSQYNNGLDELVQYTNEPYGLPDNSNKIIYNNSTINIRLEGTPQNLVSLLPSAYISVIPFINGQGAVTSNVYSPNHTQILVDAPYKYSDTSGFPAPNSNSSYKYPTNLNPTDKTEILEPTNLDRKPVYGPQKRHVVPTGTIEGNPAESVKKRTGRSAVKCDKPAQPAKKPRGRPRKVKKN